MRQRSHHTIFLSAIAPLTVANTTKLEMHFFYPNQAVPFLVKSLSDGITADGDDGWLVSIGEQQLPMSGEVYREIHLVHDSKVYAIPLDSVEVAPTRTRAG